MTDTNPELQSNDAGMSAELPVVVLGEKGKDVHTAPAERLLQGRVPETRVLYPCYVLVAISGLITISFAVDSPEWASIPVALAWFFLFVWYWFYGVAYRYRRRLLKYTSVSVILLVSTALSALSIDRGLAQVAFNGNHIAHRGPVPMLYWATVLVIVAAILLIVHVVFLGRGYRRKGS